MTPPGIVPVTGPRDLRGSIDTVHYPLDGSRAEVLIQMESGASVLVPFKALARQEDGSYRLTLDPAELESWPHTVKEPSEQPRVLPVIEETLDVQTRPVETGRVRLRKIVHESEEVVDPPLWREEVVIERVPINRMIEGPVSARSEGDIVIIPVVEEILVVEKHFLLKEEVHLTKRRVETHQPQRVTLRREEVIAERLHPDNREGNLSVEEHHHGKDHHRSV